jgi:hypothetical protein
LDQSKFGANLNPFKINLIRLENRIGRTVLPTPPVSAAPTASSRRTQPLMTGPLLRPGPPVSHVDRVALSPAPPPHGVHTSGPPPRCFLLKWSRRPSAKNFSHPTHRSSHPSTPEHRAFVPIAQLRAGLRSSVAGVCPLW